MLWIQSIAVELVFSISHTINAFISNCVVHNMWSRAEDCSDRKHVSIAKNVRLLLCTSIQHCES
jgi:hypothetical protein